MWNFSLCQGASFKTSQLVDGLCRVRRSWREKSPQRILESAVNGCYHGSMLALRGIMRLVAVEEENQRKAACLVKSWDTDT